MPLSLIDFTQSSQQILTAMINRDNATSFSPTALVFGTPAINTNPLSPRNTSIAVSAAANSGFRGSVQLNYDRLNLANVPGVRSLVFTAPAGVTTIIGLLALLNAAYRINLTSADILDGPLPVFTGLTPSQELPFNLIALPASVVFLGSVQLWLRRADIDLSAVIVDPVLSTISFN